MTLLDELAADQDPRAQCRYCAWLDTRPKAEQEEWAAACADRTRYTHASILRASKKRSYPGGVGSIETHRQNGHRT